MLLCDFQSLLVFDSCIDNCISVHGCDMIPTEVYWKLVLLLHGQCRPRTDCPYVQTDLDLHWLWMIKDCTYLKKFFHRELIYHFYYQNSIYWDRVLVIEKIKDWFSAAELLCIFWGIVNRYGKRGGYGVNFCFWYFFHSVEFVKYTQKVAECVVQWTRHLTSKPVGW